MPYKNVGDFYAPSIVLHCCQSLSCVKFFYMAVLSGQFRIVKNPPQ